MGKYFIGVDIGGTKTAVSLGGDEGPALARREFPTKSASGPRAPAEVIAEIVSAARELLASAAGQDRRDGRAAKDGDTAMGGASGAARPAAIGISCGGPLDEGAGLILSPPNLPGWDAIPIVKELSSALGAPAFLENDANACAVAEWREGAGRGLRSIVFCTFGTGFGAGLILDGRLWRGANGMAGELGHWRLSETGPVGYGKAGSFEGWCSGGGIAQQVASRKLELSQGRPPLAGPRGDGVSGRPSIEGSTDARSLAEAASAGDPEAIELLAEIGRRLGKGLALVVDLINPEAIIVGSIFARAHRWLAPAAEAEIAREALPRSASACRLLPAGLGDDVGDRAALWAARYGLEGEGQAGAGLPEAALDGGGQ